MKPDHATLDAMLDRYLDTVAAQGWWRGTPVPPSQIPHPLRVPADMLRGLVAVAEAVPRLRARSLGLAREAADYLRSASAQAGVPYAPFPYWRGRDGRLGGLSERLARLLTTCGRLDENVHNGWFTVSERPTEYFFDTGRVGEALAELFAITRDPRDRAWIDRAEAWLRDQPLSGNFNYNAFPANFHADAFGATGDAQSLEAALDRLRFGVLPGMISEGPDAGHWIDPHNERTVYRVIMVRAMIETRLAIATATKRETEAVPLDMVGALDRAIALALGALAQDMRRGGGVTSLGPMIEIDRGLAQLRDRHAVVYEYDRAVAMSVQAVAWSSLAAGKVDVLPAVGMLLADRYLVLHGETD